MRFYRHELDHAFPVHIEGGLRRSRFYGGGGEAPPPQTSTTTVQQNYSPEEIARRTQVFDAAQGIYGRTQGSYSSIVNPAPAPVGASANTVEGQQRVLAAAQGPGQQLANNMGGATNFGLTGQVLDPGMNPGLNAAMDTAVRRVGTAYTDPGGVMSKIRGNFIGGNSGGTGTREGIAGGIAGREYLNTVGDVTGKMAFDNYKEGLDFMKASMAIAPQSYNMGLQPGVSTAAVGAQQEAYQQAQSNYDAAGKQWALNKEWAALAPYASVVTGMSNPSTTTSGSYGGGQSPGGMGILGGAMAGAQMGSMFGSPLIGAGVGAVASLFGMG